MSTLITNNNINDDDSNSSCLSDEGVKNTTTKKKNSNKSIKSDDSNNYYHDHPHHDPLLEVGSTSRTREEKDEELFKNDKNRNLNSRVTSPHLRGYHDDTEEVVERDGKVMIKRQGGEESSSTANTNTLVPQELQTTIHDSEITPLLSKNVSESHSIFADPKKLGKFGLGNQSSEPGSVRDGEGFKKTNQNGSSVKDGGSEIGTRNRFKTPKKRSKTSYLAEQHGIPNTKSMYISYYIPFLTWIGKYRWVNVKGDLVAAITMASFYVPMALSYAANLGHIPPINGLYSFVFNPLIYAIFGTSNLMVVGPEAPGSLLVGSVVRTCIDNGDISDDDVASHVVVAGVVTSLAGIMILTSGLCRLGFLESVLSKPFLRGFISAIGIVIAVDQLIPEMGLAGLADSMGDVSHGSTTSKLSFIFTHASQASGFTCTIAGVSFLIIMLFRELKRNLQPRYPLVVYIPDRFLVVVIATILTWKLRWDLKGLEILGEAKSALPVFHFNWTLLPNNLNIIRESMETSLSIALLGFFESSVAAKSLATGEKATGGGIIQGLSLSPNRELVGLGLANLTGGCFCALPAFGGYGRSKVNVSTGGRTPMSSVFLSIITTISILYLLPLFYYLPKAVLSSMITVVAWSLIEEAPHDIMFFLRIRGFAELGLMLVILAATIFYSLPMGIGIGICLSILSVIRHSTRSRIQILGRIPGTNRFENAEDNLDQLEFIEGCLIVKIPEPLTFANTGQLKSRLRRLELYGSTDVHPALPRVRAPEHNKNIIFDIQGVTGMDGSGTQVLEEIVRGYHERGVRVFFSQCPGEGSHLFELFRRSGIVDTCGGITHFVKDVDEALERCEMEDVGAMVYPAEDGMIE